MLVSVLASVAVQEGNKTPSPLHEDQRHPQAPPSGDTPTLFHLCHMLALLLLHVSSASVGKASEPEILAERRYSRCVGGSGLMPLLRSSIGLISNLNFQLHQHKLTSLCIYVWNH